MFPSFPPVLALILFAPINILAATTEVCTTQYGSTSTTFPLNTSLKIIIRTTTVTQSVIYATTTVTSGVTTVPTPNGFTPILSETTSISLQAFAAANGAAAVTTQHTPTSYPTSVICTTTITNTITKTATAGQHAGTTVTSFSTTVTVPATTFYAACNANNIVDQGKGVGAGVGLQMVTAGDGPALYNSTTIENSTAYDCCVSCLTTYPCAFSILFTNYGSENPLQCALDFRLDGVCDGAHSVGPAEYYYEVDPGEPTLQPGQGLIVSNGACGQIIYGGGFR